MHRTKLILFQFYKRLHYKYNIIILKFRTKYFSFQQHAVHFNTKYDTLLDALGRENGVLVIATFFKKLVNSYRVCGFSPIVSTVTWLGACMICINDMMNFLLMGPRGHLSPRSISVYFGRYQILRWASFGPHIQKFLFCELFSTITLGFWHIEI